MPFMKASTLLIAVLGLAAFVGCEKKPATTPAKSNAHIHDDGTVHTDGEEPAKSDTHVHADGTVHTDEPVDAGHEGHGKSIELGTATSGGFSLRAARDEGALKAGGDSAIDLWITGGTAKVIGVRFWIGTEDAKGSIKAKAEIEFPAEPNHWHTHAEIPDPMPTGAKLWVEVEDELGNKSVASFELRM